VFNHLRKTLFIWVLGFGFVYHSVPLLAEEGAAEEAKGSEEGGEEAANGKEGGGGFIKKDEYLELNSSIEQMNAKIRSKNESLKKLLLDKDHVKDPVAFKDIVKQIQDEYQEIKELTENVEKKKAILRFRFPERSFVKNAEKSKVQHLEEIGVEASIEKEMTQLLRLVEKQYQQPVLPKGSHHEAERTPASLKGSEKASDLNQNPEDFSKSLLLKK
jgi:hypothetical protein